MRIKPHVKRHITCKVEINLHSFRDDMPPLQNAMPFDPF